MALWAAIHIFDVKRNFFPHSWDSPWSPAVHALNRSLITQERMKRKRTAGLVRSGMPIEKDFLFEMEPAWLKLPG